MFRAHKERNQERDEQQSPKPFWYAKGHSTSSPSFRAKSRNPETLPQVFPRGPSTALRFARDDAAFMATFSIQFVTKVFALPTAHIHPSDTAERDLCIADIFSRLRSISPACRCR